METGEGSTMNAWVAAGATALVMSERGRNFVRRVAVYGVANVMNASETFASAATSAATEVAHGAERVATSAGDLAGDLVGDAQQARHGADGKASQPETKPKPSRASAGTRRSRTKSARVRAGR